MDSSGSRSLVWVESHVRGQEAVKPGATGYYQTCLSCHVSPRPFHMISPYTLVWASLGHGSLRAALSTHCILASFVGSVLRQSSNNFKVT